MQNIKSCNYFFDKVSLSFLLLFIQSIIQLQLILIFFPFFLLLLLQFPLKMKIGLPEIDQTCQFLLDQQHSNNSVSTTADQLKSKYQKLTEQLISFSKSKTQFGISTNSTNQLTSSSEFGSISIDTESFIN